MTVQLLLAPAGAGKTAYAVAAARRQARDLSATPTVLVASALQAQSFRRRLARAGGAIGVRVLTFEQLYELCLTPTGAVYSEINDPVRHRVIRSVVRELPLVHYAPLVDQPGFVQVLRSIIDELKAARVRPESFAESVAAHGGTARLRELAEVYAAYQARLQDEGWADAAGMGWLAVEALEGGTCPLGTDWPLLLVDGFDDFTSVQLAVLERLSERVGRTVVTLTGSVDGEKRSLAHRRFDRTRRELVEILGVEPAPLPDAVPARRGQLGRAPALIHLESGLFRSEVSKATGRRSDPGRRSDSGRRSHRGDGSVELIEAANRAEEVRAALRWLKAEIVARGVSPGELALLAREVEPYRPFVRQIAAEFGLPVHVYAGEPLDKNPAVAALIDLLRLMLPVGGVGAAPMEEGGSEPSGPVQAGPETGQTEPALPPRLVIEAWRSPYFDWSAHFAAKGSSLGQAGTPIGIEPGDADVLGVVARRGRVIAGLGQWEAAFEALEEVEASGETDSNRANETEEVEVSEEGEASPGALTGPGVLRGSRVQALRRKFQRFVRRLTPPEGRNTARAFVRWLEDLIGPDPEAASDRFPQPEVLTSLGVLARIRAADETVDRDLAALRCLKRVLRGLVWAEGALDEPPIPFPEFLAELTGAAEAAFYGRPRRADEEEILVADAVAARGVPFRAVAVLGLAEGFFPAPQSEDPLLWDADREALELPLEPSTRSAEAEYFYETIAAPSERMLLTRPRLADDGAPWEPSPFWEEVQRLVDAEVTTLSTLPGPRPDRAASRPELLQSVSASTRWSSPQADSLWAWLAEGAPESVEALDAAVQVLIWRHSRADSPFDGSLVGLRDHFTDHFDADYVWSASRLEAYRTCPFTFFVGKVLGLEPREEPTEGIDWLERGLIYHEVLERVYRAVADPTDLEQLLAALPGVADAVLDRAPERYGFRRTAWWAQTRGEIVDHLRRSLEALSEEEQRGDFVPIRYEAAFGLGGEPPLVVRDPAAQDGFKLRGLIDRVDRDAAGRVRIIDYKTGGPSSYRNSAIRDGEKLQLPLYALAARDALGLGQPLSGFYWHVRHAEPSPFTLEDFGPEEAIRTAVAYAWEAIRGAREGRFTPQTPKNGCPSYCPAVGFCWRYERGYWG